MKKYKATYDKTKTITKIIFAETEEEATQKGRDSLPRGYCFADLEEVKDD